MSWPLGTKEWEGYYQLKGQLDARVARGETLTANEEKLLNVAQIIVERYQLDVRKKAKRGKKGK
jgi:hypothetical protein